MSYLDAKDVWGGVVAAYQAMKVNPSTLPKMVTDVSLEPKFGTASSNPVSTPVSLPKIQDLPDSTFGDARSSLSQFTPIGFGSSRNLIDLSPAFKPVAPAELAPSTSPEKFELGPYFSPSKPIVPQHDTPMTVKGLPDYMKPNQYQGLQPPQYSSISSISSIPPQLRYIPPLSSPFPVSSGPPPEEKKTCSSVPWTAIIVGILGGSLAILSAVINTDPPTNNRWFTPILLGLWTIISTILCWVLWHGCHTTASWWLCVIASLVAIAFFVIFFVFHL